MPAKIKWSVKRTVFSIVQKSLVKDEAQVGLFNQEYEQLWKVVCRRGFNEEMILSQ